MNYFELERTAYLNGNTTLSQAYSKLSDSHQTCLALESAPDDIREGMHMLPKEDFLSKVENELKLMIKTSRGKNKEALEYLQTMLSDAAYLYSSSLGCANEKFSEVISEIESASCV